MGLELLHYRPWQGRLRGSWVSPWPIARIALRMVFRRKLFWVLYILALVNFMIFFSGIYLLSQLDMEAMAAEAASRDRFLGGLFSLRGLNSFVTQLRNHLYLAGTAETYRNFFWFQGYIVMAVMALAGSILVGNDYQHGSLPFYLSKPLGRWHYLLGKLFAVAVFLNMMTTFPALVLYVETGLLSQSGWSYFQDNLHLLWGILGYGAVLTVCLSLLVISTATWLRKTVPMIMVWVGLLYFCRVFSVMMVDRLGFDYHWRMIDIWNNLYVLGSWCLDTEAKLARWQRGSQTEPLETAVVTAMVCILCLIYLSRRIRAVEIVR